MVGYVHVVPYAPEMIATLECRFASEMPITKFNVDNSKNLTISSLSVDEAFQRQGFGLIMVGIVKSMAREMRMVVTLYSACNAVPFYRKCGFTSETSRTHDPRITFIDNDERSVQNMYFVPDSLRNRKKIFITFI